MRSRELKLIKIAEICHGRQAIKDALEMTTQDIKFNNIKFNKITRNKEFMDIFERSLNLCLKYS